MLNGLHILPFIKDDTSGNVWSPYGTNATTAADVSNSQMIVDNLVPGEGTEKTGFLIESNKLNFISVDLENVSYSLGIKVEIYSSGGSTLLASSGPIGITGPQNLLFPIDFYLYPTVSAVDIRIIGENGTTCTSCPAENFTVQNVVCYVLDTSYIYPTTTVSICDGEGRYRYGFNTQEKDDEVYGKGNLNTALFWEYDTRLGRRWNLDPKYNAFESRYIVNGDNPNYFSDPNGDYKTKLGARLANLFKKGTVKQNLTINPDNGQKGSRYGQWYFQRDGKASSSGKINAKEKEVDIKVQDIKPEYGGKAANKAEKLTYNIAKFVNNTAQDVVSSGLTVTTSVANPVARIFKEWKTGEHQPIDDARPFKIENWRIARIGGFQSDVEKEVLKSTISVVVGEVIPVEAPKVFKDPIMKLINNESIKKGTEKVMDQITNYIVKDLPQNLILNPKIDSLIK